MAEKTEWVKVVSDEYGFQSEIGDWHGMATTIHTNAHENNRQLNAAINSHPRMKQLLEIEKAARGFMKHHLGRCGHSPYNNPVMEACYEEKMRKLRAVLESRPQSGEKGV